MFYNDVGDTMKKEIPVYSTERFSDEYLVVNSCGTDYRFGKDSGTVREHGRVDYHLLYICQGCGCVELDGKNILVKEGQLILFKPGEKHKYTFRAKDKPVTFYVHFTGTACAELMKTIGIYDSKIMYIGKSSVFKEIYEKMTNEYILKKPCYEKLCTAYFMEFLAFAERKVKAMSSDVVSKMSYTVTDKVCLHMHEKYAENLSLDYYASFCNMSTSRFSHMFKQNKGITPLEYIINIRISKAKDLLISGVSLSMSEVAELVGFSNQNYFGRVFKKVEGISPKKYYMINKK